MIDTGKPRGADELISEEAARRVAETVLREVSADDAVLHLRHQREAITRFSNNAIAQGVFQDRLSASLTVAFGGRRGTAESDAVQPDDLAALVRRAEEIARLAPADPEFLPALGPQVYAPVQGYFDPTARLSEEGAAQMARGLIAPAAAGGFRASGTVETWSGVESVATNNGLFAYHAGTMAEIGCTVTASDSSGWARDGAADLSRLDPARLAEKACDLARRSAAPREVKAGRYPTLLMPAAAARLTMPLIQWASARMTLEGLTYLTGRVGEKLAPEAITIASDPQQADHPYAPFDEQGVPRTAVTWIDRGVFGQLVWDRWTAREHGKEPVPFPGGLSMSGTGKAVEELIAGMERGILVTHIWYVRAIKADQTLYTGLTRDGTFWIEDGRIRHPVRNLRFNDSCLGMLQRTAAIGKAERCAAHEALPCCFPPLVVQDWNFVGVTEF